MDIAYGTKVYDTNKKQIGILIKTYPLNYADTPDLMGAKVVDTNGKVYPAQLDNLLPIDELEEEDLKNFNIPEWFSR
jgi:hypothetical protein